MDKELEQLSAEQAADLAGLQRMAADGEPVQMAEEAPQEDPAESLGGEIAGILMAMAAAVGPALPSLKRIYTPETSKAAGDAVARVCVKHGWLGDGLLGNWGEEIGAAVVLIPLAVTTYQGVKADVDAMKPKKAPPKVEAPGAATVQIGSTPQETTAPPAGVTFGAPIPA